MRVELATPSIDLWIGEIRDAEEDAPAKSLLGTMLLARFDIPDEATEMLVTSESE